MVDRKKDPTSTEPELAYRWPSPKPAAGRPPEPPTLEPTRESTRGARDAAPGSLATSTTTGAAAPPHCETMNVIIDFDNPPDSPENMAKFAAWKKAHEAWRTHRKGPEPPSPYLGVDATTMPTNDTPPEPATSAGAVAARATHAAQSALSEQAAQTAQVDEAAVYVPPTTLPPGAHHPTLEMQTVRVAPEVDPRRAPTLPQIDTRGVAPVATPPPPSTPPTPSSSATSVWAVETAVAIDKALLPSTLAPASVPAPSAPGSKTGTARSRKVWLVALAATMALVSVVGVLPRLRREPGSTPRSSAERPNGVGSAAPVRAATSAPTKPEAPPTTPQSIDGATPEPGPTGAPRVAPIPSSNPGGAITPGSPSAIPSAGPRAPEPNRQGSAPEKSAPAGQDEAAEAAAAATAATAPTSSGQTPEPAAHGEEAAPTPTAPSPSPPASAPPAPPKPSVKTRSAEDERVRWR